MTLIIIWNKQMNRLHCLLLEGTNREIVLLPNIFGGRWTMKLTTHSQINTLLRGNSCRGTQTFSFWKTHLYVYLLLVQEEIYHTVYTKKIKISKRLWYKYIFFLLRKKTASSYKVGHQRMNILMSAITCSLQVAISGCEVILKDLHVPSIKVA